MKSDPSEYTKYEKARIIGARALQISKGAPMILKTNLINPIEIAKLEFSKGVVPIEVRREGIYSRRPKNEE